MVEVTAIKALHADDFSQHNCREQKPLCDAANRMMRNSFLNENYNPQVFHKSQQTSKKFQYVLMEKKKTALALKKNFLLHQKTED